jgi:hypothetical protein
VSQETIGIEPGQPIGSVVAPPVRRDTSRRLVAPEGLLPRRRSRGVFAQQVVPALRAAYGVVTANFTAIILLGILAAVLGVLA